MKTHLIIDIRSLLPKNPPTGIPEYTKQLLNALFLFCPDTLNKKNVRVSLFSSGKEMPDLSFLDPYARSFLHIHLATSNRFLNTRLALFSRPTLDFTPNAQGNRTVFFAPNLNLFPLRPQTKLVTTFHDLSYERYPELLKPKERFWHSFIDPRAIARRSDALIAVSESTKQDIIDRYAIAPEKIHVVYSGISPEFKKQPTTDDRRPTTILYVGSLEGRKNIKTLVRAFQLLKRRIKNVRLLLAGQGKIAMKDKSILFLGPVSNEKRLELYQNASLFVYPSLFEGFGFPPLEAIACGVPVITSLTSSLPEAVGNAALMVNPHKARELADAMEALLTDEELRARYIKKGFEQLKKFTWQKTAQETLDVLLKA